MLEYEVLKIFFDLQRKKHKKCELFFIFGWEKIWNMLFPYIGKRIKDTFLKRKKSQWHFSTSDTDVERTILQFIGTTEDCKVPS